MQKQGDAMNFRYCKSAALASGAIVLGACFFMSEGFADGGKLVYLGIGGATQEAFHNAYLQPFQQETGIAVAEDSGFGPERIEAEVKSGHPQIDVAEFSTAAYQVLLAKDLLAPIDYKYYDPKDIANMPEGTVREKYGVGTEYTSLGMSFSMKAFPAGGPQPQSWADFWDVKKFPGKRTLPYCGALEGDWPLPEAALLADGVPPDKLYPLDMPRAIKKLKELAPNVLWWKNTSQPGQFIASGEAVMQLNSIGRTNKLIDSGVPLQYVWNGAQRFNGRWIVLKGTPNYDNAMRFLAFVARPQRQAELARLIGYAPINPGAYSYLSEKEANRLVTAPQNFKQTFEYNDAWWKDNLNKWTEACLAGLGG
jgi:putative spermidine/putrescine transport system substrate-binding protein